MPLEGYLLPILHIKYDNEYYSAAKIIEIFINFKKPISFTDRFDNRKTDPKMQVLTYFRPHNKAIYKLISDDRKN